VLVVVAHPLALILSLATLLHVLAIAAWLGIHVSPVTVALILGFLIPYVHGVITKDGLSPTWSGVVAAALAGLTAVAALAGSSTSFTLDSILSTFGTAVVGAGGSLVSISANTAPLNAVKSATAKFGLPVALPSVSSLPRLGLGGESKAELRARLDALEARVGHVGAADPPPDPPLGVAPTQS
jgi:hypothetical protein